MRSPVRQRSLSVLLPGAEGTARVERRVRQLLPRLRPGDVAVLDQLDLDRATAQALIAAGVVAVVDASPLISGRYPNLGPAVLAAAGIVLVDSVGPAGLAAIADGRRVRVHDGVVYDGETELASGRALDDDAVAAEMELARGGLVTQLQAFTHNSSEFLRREQDLLLHGTGLPRLSTRIVGRPVVVVGGGEDLGSEIEAVRTFAREQHPVLIAVGAGAEALHAAHLKPHVIVLEADAADHELPRAATLKAARDVVVRIPPGAGRAGLERIERLGVRPLRLETGAAAEDAALVLADAADPTVVVAVGMHAGLSELLDSQRPGLAGAYLARLRVGSRLVDAAAVPHLYSGRVRPWHLLLVMLAGLVALAAAIAVTPVGQDWLDQLPGALSDLRHDLSGLFT
ncbi:putative cytokinetic ring protein SteA [Nocardioides mangrovi]|uniref:SteA-like C-terminal domain-containing protein n=1 Tax=Nocardioides mangrovi TaxID=2874580 RepID=A0ABS7UIX4_9ACTN|nr:putative cytokinetic ring protein SteA [Nocardioides mangrovi]MBZ5740735.1 hypothetical protein [Nocardioides mangrovi]